MVDSERGPSRLEAKQFGQASMPISALLPCLVLLSFPPFPPARLSLHRAENASSQYRGVVRISDAAADKPWKAVIELQQFQQTLEAGRVRACVRPSCLFLLFLSLSLSCLFLLLPRSWLGSALSRTLALLLAVAIAIHHPHPLATPPLMPIRNPGHFETEEQAARAIDRKMLQTIGHHAHLLNFPLGTYPDLKHLVQNKDASNDAAPDGGGHTEPATLLPPGSASKRSRGSGSKRANIMPKPRAANEDALDDSGWDLEPADKPKGMRRAGRRGRVEAGLDIWGRRRLST